MVLHRTSLPGFNFNCGGKSQHSTKHLKTGHATVESITKAWKTLTKDSKNKTREDLSLRAPWGAGLGRDMPGNVLPS